MAHPASATNGPGRPPFPPQYVLLLLAALCLAGGIIWLFTQRPPTVTQVQATRPIRAYTLADPAALTTTVGAATPGALTDLAAAGGRLALVDIAKDAVLTNAMLLDALPPPADWLVVRLPLSGTLPLAVGETVILYAAAGDGSPAGELTDQALVIAADDAGLTVAAPPDIVSVALGYAASGRLFAVRLIQ